MHFIENEEKKIATEKVFSTKKRSNLTLLYFYVNIFKGMWCYEG